MDTIQQMNKARILRETAERVMGSDFDWGNPVCCVVGNMAQIAGLTQDFISMNKASTWTSATVSHQVCTQTGLPINRVILHLHSLGFGLQDIKRAEFGTQEDYEAWMDAVYGGEDVKDEPAGSIAARLNAWAAELEAEVLRYRQQHAISEQDSQPVTVRQRAIG